MDAPRYEGAVAHAVRAWNRARVGIRFRRVPPGRARLLIRAGRSRGAGLSGCRGENGRAMLGWPGAHYTYSTIGFIGNCRSARTRRLIAMHELGHSLGLDHEDRRCALMNSSIRVNAGIPQRCRGPRVSAMLRRGPLPDDIRGARRLYARPSPVESSSVALFHPVSPSPFPPRTVMFSAGFRNRRLVYRWAFGDPLSGSRNTAKGFEAGHSFTAPGTFHVTLQVWDGGAVIAQRNEPVQVPRQP